MLLVTGGAGFIGSFIAARLVERGDQVRILDNFSAGRRANIEAIRNRIDVVEGDVRDAAVVRRAMEGVRVVFHQAAIPSVKQSIDDPQTNFSVNVMGTLNVLQAASEAGCDRLVFASSAAVYGDAPDMPRRETTLPRPLSPYATAKLTGEHLCAVFTRVFGLETVALRYFNVLGPRRQDPTSPYSGVVIRFLDALINGSQPTISGDGEQSRDFVYIDDVVEANLRAAAVKGIAGQVFNIGSGRSVTVNTLLTTMATVLGVEVSADHGPERPGDIRQSLGDISRARELLGYQPRVAFEEGLERTVTALALLLQSRATDRTIQMAADPGPAFNLMGRLPEH
jgi:UDP-glucose 4-epimerase